MASNKFATMVQRKTNKITVILIYAMLEWVLIVLLLGNSLFSYLIIKFADYFGLKKPCVWCSRLDHILEPAKLEDSYRSLLCESHAEEISRLGYCINHRKLVESQDMCEDCSSSCHFELPENFAFFPWMKRVEILEVSGGGVKVIENGRMDSKCSCCGVVLDTKLYSHDYHLGKPSWEASLTTQKSFLILDSPGDEKVDEYDHSERNTSCFVSDHGEDEQGIDENRGVHLGNREEETGNNCLFSVSTSISKYMAVAAAAAEDDDDDEEVDAAKEKEPEQIKEDECKESADDESRNLPVMVQIGGSEDVSSEIQPMHLEFYVDQEDCHLIPVELTEVTTAEKLIPRGYVKGEEEICGKEDFVLEFDRDESIHYELIAEETRNLEEEAPLLSGHDTEKQPRGMVFDFMEINENESYWGDLDHFEMGKEELEQVAIAQETQGPTGHDVQDIPSTIGAEMESDNNLVSEEVLQVQSKEVELVSEDVHQVRVEAVSEEGLQPEGDEVEAEVSIGPEIPDQELFDDIQAEDVASSYRSRWEDPSTSTAIDNVGCSDIEAVVEFKTISIEISEPVTEYHLSFRTESNEIEEDKIPDTPTSIDSLHYIHKRLSLLERGESGAEESLSLDGSVVSDIGAGGVMTVEKLKLALTAERKALHSLYMELEEERSASAVAANQTMAMINRLQEEKAAMQMEALQYQRMMEEQVEYDQEALQLLNEVMVKREKELELCRKKIQDYEAKEKIMILRRKDGSTRSGTCSATCSAAEDSDGLSINMDHDGKENSFNDHQESNTENTPADAVLYLAESLSNFEEERLSILDQLKLLEEKLFILSDEEDQHFEDIRPVEHLYEDSGYQVTPHSSIQANGVANGHHKNTNGRHHLERKNIGVKAKRLLPLFDATDVAIEDGAVNGHEETNDSMVLTGPVDRFIDDRKLAIEEEVDHVYERLLALEADREFVRNCLASLRKGDKGIELLQEILHHLRDLRRVELRVRSMGDSVQ